MTHYAKGVAYAATGRVPEARRERDLFEAAVSRVPPTRYLFNNSALDILAIAAVMLDGELEYRKGNYDTPSPTCAARSPWTTACPTTNPGAGCSPPATPTGRCCWNRDGSRKPKRSTAPTWATTTWPGPASTRTMSGACTATTNACAAGQAEAADQAAPRPGPGPRRHADHRVVRLPAGRRRRLLRLSVAGDVVAEPDVEGIQSADQLADEREYLGVHEVQSPFRCRRRRCRARPRRRCRPPRSAGPGPVRASARRRCRPRRRMPACRPASPRRAVPTRRHREGRTESTAGLPCGTPRCTSRRLPSADSHPFRLPQRVEVIAGVRSLASMDVRRLPSEVRRCVQSAPLRMPGWSSCWPRRSCSTR